MKSSDKKSKRYVGMLIGCLVLVPPLINNHRSHTDYIVVQTDIDHDVVCCNRSRLSLFFVCLNCRGLSSFRCDCAHLLLCSIIDFSYRQPISLDNVFAEMLIVRFLQISSDRHVQNFCEQHIYLCRSTGCHDPAKSRDFRSEANRSAVSTFK